MLNECEISISFYNNFVSLNERTVGRSFWGKAELSELFHLPFSTSLFARVLTFPIYLYELFTELRLKLNITVSR